MEWSTRRDEFRWYLREHNWWWKWPLIVVTLAVWVGALALFASPWRSDTGTEDTDALRIETDDSSPDLGPPSWPVADDYADELFDTGDGAEGVAAPVEPVSSESVTPLAPLPTEQGTLAEAGATETSVVESTRSRRSPRPAAPEPAPVEEPFVPVETTPRTTSPPASSWTFAPFPTLPSSPTTTVPVTVPWPTSPPTTNPPPPPTTSPPPPDTTAPPPPPDPEPEPPQPLD